MKNKSERSRVIAVIQARMGSTRLPGKALKKLGRKTIIEVIYNRLQAAKEIDGIVLAIPANKPNDALFEEGKRLGLTVFRGSEVDIVSRLLGAATAAGNADAVVRVTADCPFVDPEIVDHIVKVFKQYPSKYDYTGNILTHSFPIGLGVELFSVRTLRKVMKILKTPAERENVSTYVRTTWPRERIYQLSFKRDLSSMRLTLDYPEDLRVIRIIYNALAKSGKVFILESILRFLRSHKDVLDINRKRIDTG